jgi:hypothetical protein
MNGPTRSPGEESTYEAGITPRQWVIMLSLAAFACIAVIMMVRLA